MKVITKHYLSKSCLDASCQWNKQRRIRSGHDDWKWVRYAIGITKMTRVKKHKVAKKNLIRKLSCMCYTPRECCVCPLRCLKSAACGSAEVLGIPRLGWGALTFQFVQGPLQGESLAWGQSRSQCHPETRALPYPIALN